MKKLQNILINQTINYQGYLLLSTKEVLITYEQILYSGSSSCSNFLLYRINNHFYYTKFDS